MSKRVLYACHDMSPLYQPVIKSLQELGFQVEFFDYYKSSILVRLMGFLGVSRKQIDKQINQELIRRVKKFKPDFLLVSKGLHLSPNSLSAVRLMKVTTINWFPDFWEFLPWIKKNALNYDYFFNADLLVIEELKKSGFDHIYYLPYATYPDKKYQRTPKKYDIIFVGQYTKRRESFLKPLVSLGLKIWGYEGWQNSSLSSCYQGRLSNLDEVLQKYREAKINLNIVTGEEGIPVKTVNLRVFEVCGVGGFLLNWHKEPIDDFYKDGKEIVNFKNSEDLLKKVKYYLQHEKEREKIALAGWRRTVRDHTFVKRFKKMFEIVT